MEGASATWARAVPWWMWPFRRRRSSGRWSGAIGDLILRPVDPPYRVHALFETPFTERNSAISPDGHWLAYEANDAGHFEIFVRPFPDVKSRHWQVSTSGGTRPLWARDGTE